MAIAGINNLCTPAYVYLVISVISIVVILLQNMTSTGTYCIGVWECEISSATIVLFIKLAYVLFWTWVLNLICKNGSETIAWFLVLLPFILFLVLLLLGAVGL